MQNIYKEIFFSTAKYVFLRNFFMVVTGIVSIFIIRLLGPYEYGKYSLVWNLISTVGPILSLGWLNTLAKFVAERQTIEDKSQLLFQSLTTVIIASIIFFVGLSFINKFLPRILPAEVKDIIFIFSFFTILVAIFNVFEGFWRGLGKFNEFVIIDGIRSNTGNILALLLLFLGFVSYKVVIKTNFFVAIFFVILLFIFSRMYLKLNFGKIDKQVIIFCSSMFLGSIIYMLSVNVDVLLLRGILRDPQQVGYYSASVRIPKIIETIFIGQFPAPILYFFSTLKDDQVKEKLLTFGCKLLGFIFGIVAVVCFIFAEPIIVFLFGNEFTPSGIGFKFFSVSLPLLAFLIILSPFYTSRNKPYVIMFIHFLIMVVFYNLLNAFFIPRYRFIALIATYLLSLTVFGFIISADCYKRYGIDTLSHFLKLTIFIYSSIFLGTITGIEIISLILFILFYLISKTISVEEIIRFKSILLKTKVKNEHS